MITPLLKFSEFSAKEKHLSTNVYQKKKKNNPQTLKNTSPETTKTNQQNSRDNKFPRSIFYLGFSHLFLRLFLLPSIKSFKYIDPQNLKKDIGFTGTSQISFLFSSCPHFFTASSLFMKNWNRLNDVKVKMGIVGLNKTPSSV